MNDAERVELRSRLREERRRLGPGALSRASAGACARLGALAELTGPGRIASYQPADGELDPNAGLALLRRRGWVVHLPVVRGSGAMVFVRWTDGARLVPNRFGIPEPAAAAGDVCDVAELDVVVVPCVAADPFGNRLGFGAGYYDRALAAVRHARRPLLVGVVHDAAVVDRLPAQEWDVPLDVIVTDERVLRP